MLAVRTDTAKLIRYPGHDDWTELFDLQADPYETKNLAGDPAQGGRGTEQAADAIHPLIVRICGWAVAAALVRIRATRIC